MVLLAPSLQCSFFGPSIHGDLSFTGGKTCEQSVKTLLAGPPRYLVRVSQSCRELKDDKKKLIMQELRTLDRDFREAWKAPSEAMSKENFANYIERKMPRQDFENESKMDFSMRSPGESLAYSPRVHAVVQEARKAFDETVGSAPELLNLAPLRQRLAALKPEDVAGERLGMLSKGEVGYVSLQETSQFTIGVFFLAPGATIPLHDHPEMCVLSHVVKGMVHVTSFDFDLSSANDLAFLVDEGMYTAPVTRTLFPASGGNLHSFSTRTGCIIVDVMSPPYDEMDGRECTYFKASRLHNQMYKVEKTTPPEDFEVLDLS